MSAKITKDWWVTFCDGAGNSHQIQLHELFSGNRAKCIDGCMESLPVGMASTQEQAQAVGRIVKRQIAAARCGENMKPETGN